MIPPRATADSPNAGDLGMSSALARDSLPASTRERIALAAAPINGCDYCLPAHSYLSKNSAKLDEAEIAANRHDRSCDSKADAAVRFPVKTARANAITSAIPTYRRCILPATTTRRSPHPH